MSWLLQFGWDSWRYSDWKVQHTCTQCPAPLHQCHPWVCVCPDCVKKVTTGRTVTFLKHKKAWHTFVVTLKRSLVLCWTLSYEIYYPPYTLHCVNRYLILLLSPFFCLTFINSSLFKSYWAKTKKSISVSICSILCHKKHFFPITLWSYLIMWYRRGNSCSQALLLEPYSSPAWLQSLRTRRSRLPSRFFPPCYPSPPPPPSPPCHTVHPSSFGPSAAPAVQ